MRKRKNLNRLEVNQDHAYAYSRTRKGGWANAQTPILGTTITISRLKKRGYIAMLELHLSFNPSRYSVSRFFAGKPLSTRTVSLVLLRLTQQNCEILDAGRSISRRTPLVYLAEPSTRL